VASIQIQRAGNSSTGAFHAPRHIVDANVAYASGMRVAPTSGWPSTRQAGGLRPLTGRRPIPPQPKIRPQPQPPRPWIGNRVRP